MVLEKVPCQIETYKQTTKSGSASSSSGGRSRLSSANDSLFLENEELSPNLGDDDSDQFEEKKAWQMQSQKNLLVKNAMEEMGWYWEHSRNDPEFEKKSEKKSIKARGVITGLDEWQVDLMNQAFDDLMIPEPDQVISPDCFSYMTKVGYQITSRIELCTSNFLIYFLLFF